MTFIFSGMLTIWNQSPLWSGTTWVHSPQHSGHSKIQIHWPLVSIHGRYFKIGAKMASMNFFSDESGSDSEGGSSSSSFSSMSDLGGGFGGNSLEHHQKEHTEVTMSSGLDASSIYNPPVSLQVPVYLQLTQK